jgi:hypothetical protein
VIHVYFVEDLNPSGCAVAWAAGNRAVVTRARGGTTLAHELGHCLGLHHPEEENPKPRETPKRLMTTGEGNRGEPYLIASQAAPARAGTGADEIASARHQALSWPGP